MSFFPRKNSNFLDSPKIPILIPSNVSDLHKFAKKFSSTNVGLLRFSHTLKSGIVVLVGIIVLVRTFARINKRRGGNKRTGVHFPNSILISKNILKAPRLHFLNLA